MGKKVAFVIGHTPSDKGAYSEFLKESELNFWLLFYHTHLKFLGDVFIHNDHSSYTERQISMAKRTAEYSVVFELHFNNFSNQEARGSELILSATSLATTELAAIYYKHIHEMGFSYRPPISITSSNYTTTKGGGFIQHQVPTALLLEPFFGSNKEDVDRFLVNKDKFVGMILDLILTAMQC